MDRRQYLGAAAAGVAVGVVGAVGNTLINSGDNSFKPPTYEPESDEPPRYESTAPYPPYPDGKVIERSGTGETTSDSFAIENDGPTIVRADHSGEDQFIVKLQSMETATVRDVVRTLGPYEGNSVVDSVENGPYELFVSETTSSWTATIYDLPILDESELTLPLSYGGELDTVIGPIEFGEEKDVTFSFYVKEDERFKISLIDRAGQITVSPIQLTAAQLEQNDTDRFAKDLTVGGVGYLGVDTNSIWTLNVAESTGINGSSNDLSNVSNTNTSVTNQSDETNQTATNSTS